MARFLYCEETFKTVKLSTEYEMFNNAFKVSTIDEFIAQLFSIASPKEIAKFCIYENQVWNDSVFESFSKGIKYKFDSLFSGIDTHTITIVPIGTLEYARLTQTTWQKLRDAKKLLNELKNIRESQQLDILKITTSDHNYTNIFDILDKIEKKQPIITPDIVETISFPKWSEIEIEEYDYYGSYQQRIIIPLNSTYFSKRKVILHKSPYYKNICEEFENLSTYSQLRFIYNETDCENLLDYSISEYYKTAFYELVTSHRKNLKPINVGLPKKKPVVTSIRNGHKKIIKLEQSSQEVTLETLSKRIDDLGNVVVGLTKLVQELMNKK